MKPGEISPDISHSDFHHAEEPRTGDGRNFRVELPYLGKGSTGQASVYRFRYRISGTELEPAARDGRLEKVLDDHQRRAERGLLSGFRQELRSQGACLVRIDGRLVLQLADRT